MYVKVTRKGYNYFKTDRAFYLGSKYFVYTFLKKQHENVFAVVQNDAAIMWLNFGTLRFALKHRYFTIHRGCRKSRVHRIRQAPGEIASHNGKTNFNFT